MKSKYHRVRWMKRSQGTSAIQQELEKLRQDNQLLRASSLSFGQIAERLAARVRELERES